MKQLSEEKAAHDDRRLIRLIRDFYIDLPSELPYNLTNGNKQDYSTDQTTFVENALNYMVCLNYLVGMCKQCDFMLFIGAFAYSMDIIRTTM